MFFFYFQLKPNRMKENESMSPFGLSSKFTTKNPATFTTCMFEEKLFLESFTTTVWKRKSRMLIWLRSGKNPATKIFAASDAFKRATPISEPIASAESRSRNLKKERSWSAYIVDAAAVLVRRKSSLLRILRFLLFFIKYNDFGNKNSHIREKLMSCGGIAVLFLFTVPTGSFWSLHETPINVDFLSEDLSSVHRLLSC